MGVDFSEGSMRALEYAIEHATRIGGRIACVHAYEDTAATVASDDPTESIRAQLQEVIAMHGAPESGVRIDPIVRRGAPWEKLANVATDLGAELIVVGADGQRGASRGGFLGTVPYRLAKTSPRAVVVVPLGSHVRGIPSDRH